MADPQVIRDDAGRPAFAVIRWQDYQRLTGDRRITGQLARYAAISASCAMRPRNSPRNSLGPTFVWSTKRCA